MHGTRDVAVTVSCYNHVDDDMIHMTSNVSHVFLSQMRERQIERLERMLDSAKSDQLEAESRRSAAEEAARLAADELAGARQRTAQVRVYPSIDALPHGSDAHVSISTHPWCKAFKTRTLK
jgi:hypothetical protein